MRRLRCQKQFFRFLMIVSVVVLIVLTLERTDKFKNLKPGDLFKPLIKKRVNGSKPSTGPCDQWVTCPGEHLGFYIRSGAASAVPPKICVNNQLVLGAILNNAGPGINIVVLNGRTGQVITTDHFNMYSGDVNPLIKLLKNLDQGSAVLVASFDDPSTKLTEEARRLFTDLGSSLVKTLAFRDNWIFVGGKGTVGKSDFEKHIKNDNNVNKYHRWPELIEMHGCLPKYL
ncbi:protein FAM3C-like isoform X1 [Synchiropus splendidus]|uniref:protein FAM3C-like isoform X1 n=1 Tax=Synchiropus splendidus TaxID=270530 RepID=UPI00237E0D93|nr:protein FAM3C-like isoform X1 [Synchiropus splendidus]